MTLSASRPSPANTQPTKPAQMGRRSRRRELHRLQDHMTRAELAHSLERVSFDGGHCLLSVDQGVRDYLLRLLRDR